ncbi:MAG: N-acetylmuramoyl-L-alanine amidase [Bacteroidota bacterium]|nr:N-acetylmuramoyl-L-alanine amidase [Bacteroidota bacterium]
MITIAWYLLKVIICSGILYGYYFLSLRNKIFHRWNRFYLLASIVLSLLVPLMKINIFQKPDTQKGTVIQMLQTISYGDEVVIEYSRNSSFQMNSENIAIVIYTFVSVVFLTIFFIALYKIKKLKKKYPETKIEGISFINTNAKGTPFSFFNSIFWNNAIDLHSKPGQQIFNHEIAHIKEKHSYDKIFMNVVLIFFWINPFFWLMRKELNMIHEFIADQQALEDSDLNAFAEMILQTVYPGQNFSIANNFFYSPLKRRILMLTKNKNPKVNYLSRLLVLPLAAIVFFAFTLKVKIEKNDKMAYEGKTITVVIDAGHGGNDNGAVSNGLMEKNVTLSIARKIAELNSNEHIKILLSRDNDQYISVKDRVAFAKNNDADMFISLHVDKALNDQINGFSVFINKSNNEQDKVLASVLINELKKSYKTADNIAMRKNKGILVLDSSACPAALIECGFLSNAGDIAFIRSSPDQEKVAKNVLNAINNYASTSNNKVVGNTITPNDPQSVSTFVAIKNDTIPDMNYKGKKVTGLQMTQSTKNLKVTYNDGNVKVTYSDGSKETITKAEAKKRGFILPPPPPPPSPLLQPPPPPPPNMPAPPPPPMLLQNALYIVDGKILSVAEAKAIDPSNIQILNVLKGKDAISKYGEKGKNGVIEITTKKKKEKAVVINLNENNVLNISANTLLIVDGKEISKNEMKNISPKDFESVNVIKGESAIKKYGEKGKDGVIEITTKQSNKENNDSMPSKVFTKVENEASFPGGKDAWIKYIVSKVQEAQASFTEKDFGTCVLKFIVNTDGTVSHLEATTMPDTKLAEVAINAIKNGPKWIPATQNDHTVAAYRLQRVTLSDPNKK